MKRFAIVRGWFNRLKSIIAWIGVFSVMAVFFSLAVGWPGGVLGSIVGWFVSGWRGVLIGFVSGSVLWLILSTGYHLTLTLLLANRIRRRVSKLSTEELCKILAEPTGHDVAFAMLELERRGIEARPSLESLSSLLTSPSRNLRGLGMSLLFATYPSLYEEEALKSASNLDLPEVWRERVAILRNAQEKRLDEQA